MPGDAELTRAFARAVQQLDDQGISRKSLAAVLGVETSTLSRYVNGKLTVPIEYLPEVDDLCRQPRGHILRMAGFVEDDKPDVLAAIEADGGLSNPDRDALVILYTFFRNRPADT